MRHARGVEPGEDHRVELEALGRVQRRQGHALPVLLLLVRGRADRLALADEAVGDLVVARLAVDGLRALLERELLRVGDQFLDIVELVEPALVVALLQRVLVAGGRQALLDDLCRRVVARLLQLLDGLDPLVGDPLVARGQRAVLGGDLQLVVETVTALADVLGRPSARTDLPSPSTCDRAGREARASRPRPPPRSS